MDFVGVGDEEGDLDFGVLLAELGDEGWEEVGAGGEAGAEEECAAAEAVEFGEGAVGFGFDGEEAGGVGGEELAGLGEAGAAGEAVEESGVEGLFEECELAGEGGLGDLKFLGGAGDVSGFGDGVEDFEVVEVHSFIHSF